MTAAGGTIILLLGTVLLRLTVTGTYRRYVRVGMGPWLAIAGAVVVALGIVVIVRALRSGADNPADDHEHGSHQRVGWLLLAPVAALLLVAPPTLGSYAVERVATVDVHTGGAGLPPIPIGQTPVPMTLSEYGQRAFDRDGASLNGASIELSGFVAAVEPGGFRLARYQIACCAADAAASVVRVVGVEGDTPAIDRWVTVTGRFEHGGVDLPELAATSVVEIPTPDDPYE